MRYLFLIVTLFSIMLITGCVDNSIRAQTTFDGTIIIQPSILDEATTIVQKDFILYHELGHYTLHRGFDRVIKDAYLMEVEADKFAFDRIAEHGDDVCDAVKMLKTVTHGADFIKFKDHPAVKRYIYWKEIFKCQD